MKFRPFRVAQLLLMSIIILLLTFGQFGKDRSSYSTWSNAKGNLFLKCGNVSINFSLFQDSAVVLWKNRYQIERRLIIFHENGTQLSPKTIECREIKYASRNIYDDFFIIQSHGSVSDRDAICNHCMRKTYLSSEGEFYMDGPNSDAFNNSHQLYVVNL